MNETSEWQERLARKIARAEARQAAITVNTDKQEKPARARSSPEN